MTVAAKESAAVEHIPSCGRCGERYPSDLWAALVMVRRIGERDLAQIVSKWPCGKVVEVRRCRRCAGLISAWRDEVPVKSLLAEAS